MNTQFKIALVLTSLSLVACGHKEADKVADSVMQYNGLAKTFTQGISPMFGGQSVIENTMFNINGEIVALFGSDSNSVVYKASLGSEGNSFQDSQVVATKKQFTSGVEYQGIYYNFYLKDQDLYLDKSSDLVNWETINNSQPVLTHSTDPSSIYYQFWNVGADVDDNGVWHLLVETSNATAGQVDVGLGYSTATLNGDLINFDTNRTSNAVVPHGGNPYVKYIAGKGLIAFHGMVFAPKGNLGQEWYVTASKLENGVWKTYNDTFTIGIPGIHICDPAAVQTSDGKTILTVSWNQIQTYQSVSNSSLEEIYDSLN